MKLTKRMQRSLERLERVPGGLVLAEDMLDDWAAQAEAGAQGFERFHWGDDATQLRATKTAGVAPGELVVELGELTEIVYETSKAGQRYDWVHGFGRTRPRLAHVIDQSGNSRAPSLLIVGGSYKVTSRGIVG